MFSQLSGRSVMSSVLSHKLFRWSFCCVLFCTLLVACGQAASTTTRPVASTPVAQDVYGTPITFLTSAPQRIVSLSPSMSEILGALQLDNKVVAVDYYTTSPADFKSKPRISNSTGTYSVEQILALKPDLVLSDGALTKLYDHQLTSLGLHVVDLPGTSLEQVLQKIILVGRLTFTENSAQALVKQLRQQIASIKASVAGTPPPTTLLELDASDVGKPFVFGGGSFGDELLQDADGINVFHAETSGGGYPQVTLESIISANPQYIILTEDPTFGGNPALVYKRPGWSSIAALKLHHVYAINVNIMQHPSQRLVDGLRCLAQILHPTRFTGPLPADCTGTV